MTATSTRRALQYKALGLEPGDEGYISDDDSLATARMALLDQFRANGEEMVTDPTAGTPAPVVVTPDGTDYRDPYSGEEPTGHIIEWTAEGRPASNDLDITIREGESGDGWYETQVPEDVAATGGAVRIKHNLDHPDVIVTCRDGAGEGMGYLFAQEMNDNECHVEFYAGTAVIRVVPNPDYVEPEDD